MRLGKRGCRVENKSFLTRSHSRFWNVKVGNWEVSSSSTDISVILHLWVDLSRKETTQQKVSDNPCKEPKPIVKSKIRMLLYFWIITLRNISTTIPQFRPNTSQLTGRTCWPTYCCTFFLKNQEVAVNRFGLRLCFWYCLKITRPLRIASRPGQLTIEGNRLWLDVPERATTGLMIRPLLSLWSSPHH